jgi:hypothetical protein
MLLCYFFNQAQRLEHVAVALANQCANCIPLGTPGLKSCVLGTFPRHTPVESVDNKESLGTVHRMKLVSSKFDPLGLHKKAENFLISWLNRAKK